MPRSWPNPWPQTPSEVRKWRIDNGYDFLLERLELPEKLFAESWWSLDGITLTMVVLTALSDYYGAHCDGTQPGEETGPKASSRFRALLSAFAPSLENRIAIPVLARAMRDATDGKLLPVAAMRLPMQSEFFRPIVPAQTRFAHDDPMRNDFHKWASDWCSPKSLTFPEKVLDWYDYAGLLFDYYRNSVLHGLRIARGREAAHPSINEILGDHGFAFYENRHDSKSTDPLDNILFGFRPVGILDLAKESIANARVWAHANDVDIFPE